MAKKDEGFDAINGILNDFVSAVSKDTDLAAEEAAKATVQHLKATSPQDKGSYAKSWTADKVKGSWVVHNKKHYRLTHLLEQGHDVVAWGKKVGHAKAYPHIKEAEELANQYFTDLLEKKINNEH